MLPADGVNDGVGLRKRTGVVVVTASHKVGRQAHAGDGAEALCNPPTDADVARDEDAIRAGQPQGIKKPFTVVGPYEIKMDVATPGESILGHGSILARTPTPS